MARTLERYAPSTSCSTRASPRARRPGPVAEPHSRSVCQHASTSLRRCRALRRVGAAIQQGSHQAIRRCRPAARTILAVRVADLGEKEAVRAAQRGAFFTIPHFDGYSTVLIQLENVSRAALREAIIDGWLACAPARLVDQYLGRWARHERMSAMMRRSLGQG